MPKITKLSLRFQPEKYELDVSGGCVRVYGKKIGPPSKRITLHQKGLKVTSAKIARRDKKGEQKFTVVRINNLPTLQQVRLHSDEMLFPGYYEITINFYLKNAPKSKLPKRELFPCIDEPEAWANATVEIK